MTVASVILDVAIDKALDYAIPAGMCVKPGMRVEAPLKGKPRPGTVLEIKTHSDFAKLQPLHKMIGEDALPIDLIQLAQWMSQYYCSSLNDVLHIMLPGSVRKNIQAKQQLFVVRNKTREELKAHCESIRNRYSQQAEVIDCLLTVKKGILLTELLEKAKVNRSPVETLVKNGWLAFENVYVDRSPLEEEEYFRAKPKTLNAEQAASFAKIVQSIEKNCFETHLIHGITGSGKTEIYLQAIQKALDLGKGSLMLVPEISLTTQMIERFRSRFSEPVAILHHRLSDGERHENWKKIAKGEIKIVVGARSAVFSPIPNLGLVIVDEEHEGAYKQTDDMPCYNGRDVAVMRGKFTNSTVLLGSATPSLESYLNAKQNKYILSTLQGRADTAKLPAVTIVDMKKEFEKTKGFTPFSETLLNGIEKRFKANEQTILFLNRRGYHSSMLCTHCGKSLSCRHCDVTLTFHQSDNVLACHLCGFSLSPPPKQCPSCRADTMKYKGIGTELVEKSLKAVFPEIRTLRIDADTTRHKGSHQKLIRDFNTGKADVLIGTQMIAKGLHFPEVTLVGILNGDPGLNIPDYRASEISFQLITQVAGRSGRGVLPGEVILQTAIPENSTILHASQHDYIRFYEEEIAIRQMFQFPPFNKMTKVLFSGSDAKQTFRSAEQFRVLLIKSLPAEYVVQPVLPSGHARVKDRFRFQFIIRGPAILPMSHAIKKALEIHKIPSKMKVMIDVNPTSTFL